jgi:DSF synthase
MNVALEALNLIPAVPYRQISLTYDATPRALWLSMHPGPRPCFTPTLLAELGDCQRRSGLQASLAPGSLDYFILASAVPEVFNLGGDLELFVQWIRCRDREALLDYGRSCIDAVYQNGTGLGVAGLTTIALVQGAALGGGLEAALSANVLIAERGVEMGFPEILFNLFPGMGAYSLLARRVGHGWTERLIRGGARYSAERLYRLGVVDVLAPRGGGVGAVRDFMRRRRRFRKGDEACDRVRRRLFPLRYEELLDVVAIWADAALKLTSGELRMMDKLVAAQLRRRRSAAGTGAVDRARVARAPATSRAL